MNPLQKQYQYLKHFRAAIQNQQEFPFGTIAYYGPNDQVVTKVIAGVLPDEQTNPILKKWVGEGIAENPQTIAEIGDFFRTHQVKNVIMPEGIIGCPHEEGIDFPSGEDCPECVFWKTQ